ncbi:hypothetical protein FQA39_LY04270 [Lamprigera yunnana]|nr:hypothetical protein FQA39_LY04270 [Lamprigera yunnana]
MPTSKNTIFTWPRDITTDLITLYEGQPVLYVTRTQYLKEVDVLKKFLVNGATAEAYKPKLWCYDLLNNLSEGDPVRDSLSNLKLTGILEELSNLDLPTTLESSSSNDADVNIPSSHKRVHSSTVSNSESVAALLNSAVNALEEYRKRQKIEPDDEFHTFGSKPLIVQSEPFLQWPQQLVRCYSSSLPPHTKVTLPALSPTMQVGNLVRWEKKEGDKLSEGDLLVEIETDKATMGFETPEEGYLAKIIIPAGTKEVPIGKLVCIIVENQADVAAFKDFKADSASPPPAAAAAPAPSAPSQIPSAPKPTSVSAPASSVETGDRVYASPMAKRLAEQRQIRLQGQGTGLFGSITSSDLDKFTPVPAGAAASPSITPSSKPTEFPSSQSYVDIPLTTMREVIAKRLLESKQTVPHYYVTVEINMDKLLALRERINKKQEKKGVKVSVNDFVIKATAMACKKVPAVNALWMNTAIRQFKDVDVSVAVSTPTGLITPIIFEANSKGVIQISQEMKVLAVKAKEGKLKLAEFQGGTISVSNLGMFGVKHFTAIINPPQSAILAVGSATTKLVPYDNDKGFKSIQVMNATLSSDHRVIDGVLAAEWLSALRENLEDPVTMILINSPMRSSVSYILSSTTSEPNMSHPDYEQYSHDHAAHLILVKQIGSCLKTKIFNKFFERISRVNNVKITDSTGQVRNILVRYVKEHPVENNDWGDFQTHRRLLGLISLGRYDSQQELNEICRVHESLKVKYTSTLFDSRCILFGVNDEREYPSDTSPEEESSSSTKVSTEENSEEIPNSEDKPREKFTTPTNFKTRGLFYNEADPCTDLENQLIEFINSLFWVLESKRLERSREKIERVSLLLAPFEKKDFVGLDMDSRNNKKRCNGRMTKHLGDLYLQAGLLSESLGYYHSAVETLKSVNDWLWLGAAYEGLCAASALVLYPNIQRNFSLHRNASLPEGSPKRSNSITMPIETVKRDIINMLPPEEISKRYREAIIHYSKYQNAGIIETEASFKAARISVEQNHFLQAASFLQNVVFINLTLSEQEKIQRFETLSDLYLQIGFTRKAAFCQRLAAMRHVSPQNPTPNWNKCYNLILKSFPGHKIPLDPTEISSNSGWPALQIQLLQELVVAAKRMGHSALATRHMTFLLQTMWQHLSTAEQKEFAIQLQSLSSQCEGGPVPLVLDSGIVIPPANLSNLPVCSSFTLRNLQPHLQPRKIETSKEDLGPFLFTPIKFGTLERSNSKPQSKMDFLWVANDVCEITLKLVNPLPFELKVSDMRLLTSGPVFESIPETVVLPSDTPTSLTLNGTPKEGGELEILGYSTHTLGVKSNCRLRHMPNFLPLYSIEVIPVLPTMEIKTSLPQSATFSSFQNFENVVTSASISLYNGESTECTITIKNNSVVPIEMLEVSIQSVLEVSLQDQIFKWSQENLESQLPLVPGGTASLTLYLYSAANFLASGFSQTELSSGVFGSSHCSSVMSVSAGPSSLPSRLNSPIYSTMGSSFHGGRRNELNSSFRSSNSGQSSMTTTGYRSPGVLTLPHHAAATVIEGQLQLRYSGGEGLKAGYCRSCSIFITLEMLPSLQVTNWDVLPAETSSQFYLVLDIANMTSQEMELYYTPTKHMLIEGHESCRVPVPVNRCPLSKLTKLYMDQNCGVNDRLDLDKICSEHIANLVDLRWQLMALNTRGKATLKGITLTPNMLDIVRMSPLNWEVSINGDFLKPQEEINCEVGDCLNVEIGICNSLEKPLQQLVLSVQFYQDHRNGTHNYRLETRVAIVGCAKKVVPILDPQTKAWHACNVLFLTSGQYKMDIQCSTSDISCTNASLIGPSGHSWRYIPAVDVNVHI